MKKDADEVYAHLCKGPSKLNPDAKLISGLDGRNRHSNGSDFKGVMLANKYNGEQNIDGWYLSEKLDGIRWYYDGSSMRTRNGGLIHPPLDYYEHFPHGVHLDGELWVGRNQFHEWHSIVRSQDEDKGWYKVKYLVFDAPKHPGTFTERLEYLKNLLADYDEAHIKLLEHRIWKNVEDLTQEMKKIKNLDGEGVVLRDPNSYYEFKRSNGMLKVKEFHDDEATIIGYENGTGKYKDVLGAVIVKGSNGAKFKVGSGFSDEQRKEKIIIGRKIKGTAINRFNLKLF